MGVDSNAVHGQHQPRADLAAQMAPPSNLAQRLLIAGVHAGIRFRAALGPSMTTAADVRRLVETAEAMPSDARPPQGRAMRGVRVRARRCHGLDVYELDPAAPGAEAPRPTVIYLHGGGYVGEIARRQWAAAADIAVRSGARVVVPIYPLAPAVTADVTVDLVAAVVRDILAGAGSSGGVLLGESAGGGLALAVALAMRDRADPLPHRLVLVSPWLDVTVSHPDQPSLQRRDVQLSIEGLRECGRLYAGHLDVSDRRVSPLGAALHGIPPMTLLCGTRDILLVDARRLRERARSSGVAVDYAEVPGMLHSMFLTPLLPDSKRVRGLVAAACSDAANVHR